MRYEILKGLPTYGPLYIPISESNIPFYSEGFVVRFFRSDGTSWAANFQKGFPEFNAVHSLAASDNILVIASGTCYLMHPDITKPIAVLGGGYEYVFTLPDERLVLQGTTFLTIIEPDGSNWDTERISWDGLKEVTIQGSCVSGLAFDLTHGSEEWSPFTYDIDKKELTEGSYFG